MGRKSIPKPIKSLNAKVSKAFKAAKREIRTKLKKLQSVYAAKALKSLLKSHLPLAAKHKASLVNGRFVPMKAKIAKKGGRPRKK